MINFIEGMEAPSFVFYQNRQNIKMYIGGFL